MTVVSLFLGFYCISLTQDAIRIENIKVQKDS